MSALQDHCGSQTAGGALGDEGGAFVATDQLVGHRQQLAGAGGPEGMAEADRSAVDVELLVGDLAERLVPAEVLLGELCGGEGTPDGAGALLRTAGPPPAWSDPLPRPGTALTAQTLVTESIALGTTRAPGRKSACGP